jgi:hypothetical protein
VTVPALYAGLEEGEGVKELLMVVHFALVFVLLHWAWKRNDSLASYLVPALAGWILAPVFLQDLVALAKWSLVIGVDALLAVLVFKKRATRQRGVDSAP